MSDPVRPEPAASATASTVPDRSVPSIGWTQGGLLTMALIWAINFSVIKAGLGEISPFAFNALRFPFAALLLYVVLRSRGPIPRPDRADIGRIVFLGVLGNIIYQFFFILGMNNTRAGNASLLLATTPIFTAIGSVAAGHEPSDRRLWTGAAATLLGMAMVIGGGTAEIALGRETLVGDLLIVGASVVWSIYTVAGRGPIRRYGSIAVTAWTLWIGTAGLLVVGAPAIVELRWNAVPVAAWGGVLYAGILGIGVAYLFWYRGVQQIGSTRTAVWSNVVPVLALLVAWIALGEVPTPWQIAGAVVIIAGVRVVHRR